TPEVGVLEIFLRAVTEQPLDILADESRGVIVPGLERIDHRRRALEQGRQPRAGGVLGLLGTLAVGHVAPRAHDLEGLAALVADEMLLVADPAILAVLLAEAVFRGVLALLEDLDQLGLDPIDVIGVDASAPEGWILQIFGGTIAKQPLDVLADEGRRVIVSCLEGVDHRGRRLEQKRETPPRLVPGGFGGFARGDVAPGADDLLRLALLV